MLLAKKLRTFKGLQEGLVLALPRGGVVVGYEVAHRLHIPLDVFVTRKLGYPGRPELAVGALAETGAVVLNPVLGDQVPKDYLDREIRTQKEEVLRRIKVYRGGKSLRGLSGKRVILIDDGLATGATAKAAVEALKQEQVKELIVAVPVAPEDTAREFEELVDVFICLRRDPLFFALGSYYVDFNQVSDEEVTDLLRKAAQELEEEPSRSAAGIDSKGV